MRFIIFLLVLGITLALWIRLAPTDPKVWHVAPDAPEDMDHAGGVRRRVPGDHATLARLHQIALATPRTKVLLGRVEDGHITYVTRSRVMGFPDYATVALRDGHIEIFSRLRFGKKDFGVNKAKIEAWLSQLQR